MRKLYIQLLALAKLLCLLCFASTSFAQVSGTVYQDFNGNGVKNNSATFNEVGLRGVTVNATNASGAALTVTYVGGGTSTNTTGQYAVTGGTLGQIRLEFVMPDGHTFASKGAASGTSIMFPTTATQDLGVFYPQNYSAETNPRVAVQWYTNGNNQLSGTTAATPQSLVTFPHDNDGAVNSLANMGSIGATWGLAYHKQSGKLFSAAFAKRHVNTGSLGLEGIYVTSNAKTANSLTATTAFVNLKQINNTFDAGAVTRDFAPGQGSAADGNRDVAMFDQVGKVGLGDLSVSDDGQYLYTINLNDRRLWRIEVGATGTAPTSESQVVRYGAFPNPCTSSTFRPFAVRYYKGDIYVGGVCDGVAGDNSSVNRNNLKVTIYKVSGNANPSGATFTEVFSFPLTYSRNANIEGLVRADTRYFDPNNTTGITTIGGASWRPWVRSFNDIPASYITNAQQEQLPYGAYPQPMLIGLEFDVDGSMILGFGDRTGHQMGNANRLPISGTSREMTFTSGGDLLRAYNNNGTYELENNGIAGPLSTGGANNGQGPGGGEFYWRDVYHFNQGADLTATAPYGVRSGSGRNFHEETSLGGLTSMAGKGAVLVTSFDPRRTDFNQGQFSGGVRWYSNTDGTIANGLTLYNWTSTNAMDPSIFGKAGGIGDIELMTNPAPIEIGNRVWLDSNNNGIQDAGEAGLPNITVTLYAANGTTVIATAVTNAQGEYYFSSATGTNTTNAIYGLNILPNTQYVLSYPTTSGVNLISTKPNTGTNDLLDSDADGLGKITFTTRAAGENNHSFDVGYYVCPTVTAPVVANGLRCQSGAVTTSITTACASGYNLNIFSNSGLTTNVTSSFTISATSLTGPSITQSTTYYATCSDGTCVSTANSFELRITPAPAITVNSPTICTGQTASLTASGCTGGTITWSGGLTGNPATTPVLTANQTYTATCTVGTCTSTAVATVTVNSAPAITVNSPTICTGQTASLTASGCTGGTITWSGGLTGNPATTPVLIVNQTYTATCTVGTCTSTAVATVTVTSAPAITVNSPTICTGQTASLTASGCTGGTITWSGGLTGNPATTPVLTANQTYTATCTVGTCTSTAVATVTVTSAPAITVNSPTICTGETATLTVDGCTGGTITWSGGLTGNPATTPVLTSNQTYTATCTVGTCTSTAVATVTVTSAPAITVNSPTVCTGETATLTVDGCIGGAVTWSGGLTGNPATTPVLTANQTYTATCTVGTCTSTAVATVTVTSAPAITVNSPTICTGQTASLTASGCTGGTITWSGGLTGNPATTSVLTANQTYTATCTVGTCTSTAVATVTVTSAPAITVNSPTICTGETATLTVDGCTGGTITWSGGLTGNPATTPVLTANQTYTATCTVGTCTSTAVATVTVTSAPAITVNSPTICTGETATLTVDGCTGGTITWSGGLTGNPATTPVLTANQTYTATCTVGTCTSTAVATVTVTSAPAITVNSLTICTGETATLTVDGCTGGAVTWSGGLTGNPATTPALTANQTYTATCTVGTCTSTVVATVTVTSAPAITVNSPTICTGETATLEVDGCTGGAVTWSGGLTGNPATTPALTANQTYTATCTVGTCISTVVATVTVTTLAITVNSPSICAGTTATLEVEGCTVGTVTWSGGLTGNPATTPILTSNQAYTATCTDANGCTATAVATVTVGTEISLTVQVAGSAGSTGVCYGESATLTVVGCESGVISWTGGLTGSPATTPALTANQTYTATCTVGGDCSSTVDVTVIVNPLPVATATATSASCNGAVANADGSIVLAGFEATDKFAFTEGSTYSGSATYLTASAIPADGVITNTLANPSTVTDYTIRVFNEEGCYIDLSVTLAPAVCNVFDLALRKVMASGPKNPTVTAGDSVTFKLVVYNQGNVDAKDISLVDYIPAGLTLADTNWTAVSGVATLNDTIATLAAGDSTSVNITFTVNTGVTGSVRNIAEISGADNDEGLEDIDSTPDDDPNNDGTPKDDNISEDHKNNPTDDEDDHDFEDITVTPEKFFDLALRKVLPSGPKNPTVSPGDSVTFKIDVFNQGNVDATDIEVIDYIPNGLTLADSNWVLGTGVATLKDPIAALAAGDSISVNITFVVNGDQIGSVRNFAEISGADNAEGLEDIDSTPDTDPDNDGTSKDDEIGEDGKNNPDDDEDDHDFEEITVRPALVFDLALRKVLSNGVKNPTVRPGDSITFEIKVYNQGNVDATDIEVIDYIPNGLTLADSNWVLGTGMATLKDPIAALAAGDSTSVNITFLVNGDQIGSVRNFAEISGADNAEGLEDIDSTPDTDPDNDGTSKDDEIGEDGKNNPDDDEDDHDFEEITVRPALVFDLALRKVLPNGVKNPTVRPGDSITFEIKVYNQGNVDATDIEIADTIPEGLSLSDSTWSQAGGVASLTNPIAALTAGDSTSVTIVFTIDADFTGSIRNVAKITGYKNEHGLEDIDSDPDKEGTKDDEIDENGIDGDDEDSNDFEEITVLPDLVFDLALRKTMTAGSKTIFKTGDTVSFDITVFNQGTVAATSVDLVDYIPAGLTLQDSSWTLDGNKARWIGAITALAPGAQRTVTISFVVDSSATGVIINSAEISGAENDENLEDIDSTPDDDKDNDGPVKDDEINEDGKDGRDEDDHDIEPITICPNAKCLDVKVTRIK